MVPCYRSTITSFVSQAKWELLKRGVYWIFTELAILAFFLLRVKFISAIFPLLCRFESVHDLGMNENKFTTAQPQRAINELLGIKYI